MTNMELVTSPEELRVYSDDSYGIIPSSVRGEVLYVANSTPQEIFDSKDSLKNDLLENRSIVSSEYADIIERTLEINLIKDKFYKEIISAHQVGEGQLSGYKRKKTDTGLITTDKSKKSNIMSVALKPFNDAEKATNEFLGYKALQSIGIETFDPVGVFPSKDGNTFVVVTKFRPGLQGLDHDEWLVSRKVQSEKQLKIHELNTRTIKEIAETLAVLHSNGVFHPDGQIKNWAFTAYGQIGVIDTENLETVSDDYELGSAYAWRDIQKLFRSLIKSTKEDGTYGVGMLAGMSNETMRNCFEELFLNPYVDKLADLYKNDGNSVRIDELYSGLIENYFHDADSWPSSLVDSSEQDIDIHK